MSAKCPKCDKAFDSVNIELITIRAKPSNWRGLAYICPHCQTTISIQIDPVALKSDGAAEVVAQVKLAVDNAEGDLKREIGEISDSLQQLLRKLR